MSTTASLDIADNAPLDSLTPEQLDHVAVGVGHCFGCILDGNANEGYVLRGGGIEVALHGRTVTVKDCWDLAEAMAP